MRQRHIDLFEDMPGGHEEPPVVEGRKGEVGVVLRGVHAVLEVALEHAQSFCRTAKSNILSLSSTRVSIFRMPSQGEAESNVARCAIFARRGTDYYPPCSRPPAPPGHPPRPLAAGQDLSRLSGRERGCICSLGANFVPVTQRSWQENTIYIRR